MAQKLYTVQAGDYLRKIAIEQLGDQSRWSEIAYINELSHPYIIRTNQILLLPNNDEPLQVVITKGIRDDSQPGATTIVNDTSVKEATMFTPVTIAVLAVVAVAFLLRK